MLLSDCSLFDNIQESGIVLLYRYSSSICTLHISQSWESTRKPEGSSAGPLLVQPPLVQPPLVLFSH